MTGVHGCIAKLLLLSTAAMVSACHHDSGAPPAPPSPPHVNPPVTPKKAPGPSPEALTAGMVEAVSQGKSQLAVKLKFDLAQRPVLGQPLDIDIAVLPQIDALSAGVQVVGGDGLTLGPDASHIDLPAIQAGQVYRQSIRVTPTAEGVLLLGLTVSLKHDDVADNRTFSIPLIVER